MHLRGTRPQIGDSVTEQIKGYQHTYTVVNSSDDGIEGAPTTPGFKFHIFAGTQYFQHNSGTRDGGSTSAEDYFGGDY